MISDKIDIEWVGVRKDANKGSFWGYFVPKYQKEYATRTFDLNTGKYIERERYYYRFSGKIGKSAILEKCIMDENFMPDVNSRSKNFKFIEVDKFFNKCGAVVIDSLKEQLSFMMLTGEFIPLDQPERSSFSWT